MNWSLNPPPPHVTITWNDGTDPMPLTNEQYADRVIASTVVTGIFILFLALMFWMSTAIRDDRHHQYEDRRFAAACGALGGVPASKNYGEFTCIQPNDLKPVSPATVIIPVPSFVIPK